ncbi:leucyl aminopeptidase family protein [Sphingomonas lacunae]|uniref:Leucyl aminopeptidase family protein n=1 Tax=Sphingomonas lacunae TaxID=2698828 RepID=A0A6M4ATD5_9SPHN|nr:leucyl aminopeptidase family protein [Sphingomonas lacunae]QJQ32353.1 leucyl aminopeptidase family protein [Sphingomonas lacunae]
MTDFSPMLQPDKGQPARTIHVVDKHSYESWLAAQPERARTAISAQGMKLEGYAHAILPGDGADDWSVVTVTANAGNFSSWCLAKLAAVLPAGTYRLASGDPGVAMFGWLTGQYRYIRYKPKTEAEAPRVLLTTDPVRMAAALREATAVCMVRDLVNTTAADLGPAELEQASADLARKHKADLTVTKGDALEQGYPMIAAVGRAAGRNRAPRLIELVWGNPAHPPVAIVGKGVTFDSGGLNIKPGNSMALMKKDMGGAAHALALASLVMETGLPVRLHLLVAAVENSIAGDAMRPGDILTSRKGLTVEIDNTDAEGRLILGDALTKAVEGNPELIIDFATLTGAARVALGPDLPALFANDDALADAMISAGKERDDPLWRLPLWDGYDEMLKSDTADMTNSPAGGFAGSITAALFLRRFVPKDIAWAHFDTFAWRPSAKPGRAKGGAALGLRAAWGMLEQRFKVN